MNRPNAALRPALAATLALLMLAGCSPSGETADDAEAAASATVTLTQVREETWPDQLDATGGIRAWQELVVSAETGPYRIASLNADVGTSAGKGAVLATLSRDALLAEKARLEAAVAEARANLSKARSDVRRADEVADTGALSQQEIEGYRVSLQTAQASLASAQAQLKSNAVTLTQTSVRAPDSGVVTSRSASLGQVVTAGTELFRMVRSGIVEWQAELTADQLQQARAGQNGRVTLPDGTIVVGTVRQVSPTLDGDTSRGIAYVRLPAGSGAQAGMYADGVIEAGERTVLTLPETAVVLRDGKSYVFTLGDENRVRRIEVVSGQRRDGRVAVSGLESGTRVVANGASFLSDGAVVRVRVRGANTRTEQPATAAAREETTR